MSTVSIANASRSLSRLLNQAAYGNEVIILTSRNQPKAVLLGMDAFQRLVGARAHRQGSMMPLDTLQFQFQQALTNAGYDTIDKNVDLVRDVKQEMADER